MKFVVYKESGGNWRWRLVASNGQAVASAGEGFGSRSSARNAAKNVKARAGDADVVVEQ